LTVDSAAAAAAATAAVQLVELFGSVRDNWIAQDLSGWLAPNRIYPGVADAVAAAMQQSEVYIVTTKQVCLRACLYGSHMMLLHDTGAITFPAD
jgi:hypothetical protein